MANADGVNNQKQIDVYNIDYKKDLKPKDSEKAISLFNALKDEVNSMLSCEADANHDGTVDKGDLAKLHKLRANLLGAAININKHFDKYIQQFDAKGIMEIFRNLADDIALVISRIECGRYTSPKEERENLRAEKARKEEARKAEEERMANNNSEVKESDESGSAKKDYAYIDKKADAILSKALTEDKRRIEADKVHAFNPTYYDRSPCLYKSTMDKIKDLYMNTYSSNGGRVKNFENSEKASQLIKWAELQLKYQYINEKEYNYLTAEAHKFIDPYYGQKKRTAEDDYYEAKVAELGKIDRHAPGFWSAHAVAKKAGGYRVDFDANMKATFGGGYTEEQIARIKKENGIK